MAERICNLFRELVITIVTILTTFSMTTSTIALAITSVFGGEGSPAASGSSPQKYEEALEIWLDKPVDVLKRLAGKANEAFSVIVRNVAGAILSFLGKDVRFVARHTWALIDFILLE